MRYLGKGSVASFLKVVLSVAWGLGIAVTVLFVVVSVMAVIFGLPKGMDSSQHLSLNTDFGQVQFTDGVIKNPQQLIFALLPFGAVMIGLGMAIIYQLRKIFATLTAGNPFVIENAGRIRKIALLIFGGAVVRLFAARIIGQLIMDNLVVKGMTFNAKAELNLDAVFVGLVVLIIGEIFRQGTLLKEEHDLTV